MKSLRRSVMQGLSAAVACAALAATLDAACNCRGGTVVQLASQTGLPAAPPPPLADEPTPLSDAPQPPLVATPQAPPTPMQPQVSAPQIAAPVVTSPGVNRFGMTPPPGTLGRTYHQRSKLADDDKHPRYGAVEVKLPENVDVSARGLKAKWNGKVWLLEAETPLLPGVPHIYAIKAERDTGGAEKSVEVRWVRLIMGRVVELEF
jgi:hypothetical protein